MNVVELMKELSAQGVEFWRDGDRLRYRAPREVLTPTLLIKIKHHKADILELLQGRADASKAYPLAHGQRALWLLHKMAPQSAAYNFELALRIRSNIDKPALRRACQALIDRHPALRTTFTLRDSEPVQEVHDSQEACFEETDASTWTWAELNKRVIEAYQRPIDLERGPLLRVNLFTRSERDCILLLTAHHIVYDGWSSWLCQDELGVLYAAEKAGSAASLPSVERTYADYVRWQTEMLADSAWEPHGAYWLKQLAGDLPALNLPTDRPRPAVQTYRGASHTLKLSVELTMRLKELTQAEGATLYMILVAAFQVLLHRYTGQKDILVGSPTAGRNQPEWARVVGYFVNPVVLRANLAANPTFKTFLSQVRRTVLDALAHQDYPFPLLVERLQHKADPSYSPLFQVSFVLHKPQQPHATEERLTAGESEVTSFEIAQHGSQFDLTLELTELNASLFGVFKYNTDLFDATTISRMAGHFQYLLEGIVAHPEQRISDLPLLTQAEQQQLLITWNNTQAEYPRETCLHQWFQAQVERTPDAIAVLFEDQKLSYAALNQRANQLAHHLKTLGVKPEVLVGICIERSLNMVIGLLGILKAGGAYLPLDPAYPAARFAFLLEDAGVPVLVTTEKLAARLPQQNAEHQTRLVCLDTLGATLSRLSKDNPNSGAVPSNLAYVIYTSGSTGKPKGVMITHQSVVNFLSSMRLEPGLTAQDILLAVTTISFDIAALEIYLPLMVGAQVVLVSREVAYDGVQLCKMISQYGVTITQATPTTWRLLLSTDWEDTHPIKILCGGEALPRELATRLLDKGTTVWNLYGPTETTIWSAVYPVERHETSERLHDAPELIGRPIANTQVYVLDQNQKTVPIGVPGELHISGAGLARGYLNRPKLTAEKFIPNPFSNRTLLYKTGDLARYLPDGNIEYLGRLDHQVKIRGFRIELGEIEAVLTQHQAVRESVVIADTDQRLVAYIVPTDRPINSDNGLLITQLRRAINQKLPDYMVPSAFMLLDALPLTQNGKIDRQALPMPTHDRPTVEEAYVAPRTELELFLATRWQKLLAIEQIGVHENFYELGGDSIKGVFFINHVNEELKEFIHIVALFDAPNIADFAVYLKKNYAHAVSKRFKTEAIERHQPASSHQPVDQTKLDQLRQLMADCRPKDDIRAPLSKGHTEDLPPPIFILSPPRSGSTLLRVMLAGHPRLFSPPELELLSFNTLKSRKAAFSGRLNFQLEGTIRAIMALKNCTVEQATQIMAECEDQNLTAQQCYRLMQTWCGEKRLVDKTPGYTHYLDILERAETYFDNALYIHLLRHPYGMIRSFEESQLSHVFFNFEHPFTTRELGELVWLNCHQNIMTFLQQIPKHRQYRLGFEELVHNPRPTLEDLCRFFELEFNPEMLQPYKDRKERMTDGITPLSTAVGDGKFDGQHKGIDPAVADRWKKDDQNDFIGEITKATAKTLGYEDFVNSDANQPLSLTPIRPSSRQTVLPLSFAQQRLWFLDQLEGRSATYNMPIAQHLTGPLNVIALEQSLGEIIRRHETLRTTFPMVNGQPTIQLSVVKYPLPVVDLQHLKAKETLFEGKNEHSVLSNGDFPSEVERLINKEAQQPFYLSKGPLFRATVLKLAEQEHILLLTLHHIITDGWSIGILFQELGTLYAASCHAEPSPLAPLSIQYVDFAHWQRQWLTEEALEKQGYYWKNQLANAPALLELPTDHPRPPIQRFRGAQTTLKITPDITRRLKNLSQQTGGTLFVTLLAAFATLLSRYNGQSDIVIGSLTANRTHRQIEPLIGFFVNTLALRIDLSGNPRFEELLRQVRRVALDAYAHQDIPFEKLVEELQPERTLSHTPLFQVMFVLHNAPMEKLELADLNLTPIVPENSIAKFDLTLAMRETAQGLAGRLEYNTDLFEPATITRMGGHFQTLLEGIVNNPQQSIARLPLLTETEYQQRMAWNDTATNYPQDQCLHQLFEAQAEKIPDAVAVVFEDRQLTYRELNNKANQLAHDLQTLGVKPEALVGICIERSIEMLIGLLGILKAGGAYLPLDPAYPAARLAFMIEDAGVGVLLTQSSLVNELPKTIAQVVCLDTEMEKRSGLSTGNLDNGVAPSNLAYVIYTSGSTGRPKGVAIEHRSTVALLAWSKTVFTPKQCARILASTSLSFDLSVFELFLPLSWGGTVILVEDALHLAALPDDQGVTLVNTVPSAMSELVKINGVPASVQVVNLAGEPLHKQLVQEIYHIDTIQHVFNLYGPSEDTTYSTFALMKKGSNAAPVIGRPVANTKVYILDAYLQPVPAGVSGELHIGGAGLARGYFNRPELTLEKFIPNPFSDEPESRLYKTGDLARYLPDGNIEYLGRIDNQVKIRGFRIELGEIEAILAQHPAVRENAVIVHQKSSHDKRLVAYLVANNEQAVEKDELRGFLNEKLPGYMIPSIIAQIETMPLTSTGKIDRRSLSQSSADSDLLSEEGSTAPRTQKEEQLASIWASVLGLGKVGIHDNFFDLGGHSLLATQIVSRVRDAFSVELPLRSLFETPTVAGLVERIPQQLTMADDDMNELLAELEGLSEEEAQRLHTNEL